MAVPSRMEDRILVLSKLKQANYATILTDVNLQGGKRFMPEAAVFGQPDIKRYSTRPLSMTGHDYAIQLQQVERSLLETLTFPMESWLAAWTAAFGMGLVTSSQPNAGSNPTAWKHVIKPFDPSAGPKDLPVTTIYTEAANVTGLQRRLQSMCVKDFSLEFPASAPGKITANLIGSGQITTGVLATPPAIPTYNFLMSNDMSFLYGPQGAPVDISSQIVLGSVKFTFTWNMDDANSRAPGGGLYRSRAWVTQPDITLTFNRFVDDALSTPDDDWLADTIQEVNITVAGPTLGVGPEKHQINIRGLAVVPTIVKLGQSGNKSVYQYTFSPDHWLKQGAADVVTITCQNLESSFLI
jgi:hypothetical protein